MDKKIVITGMGLVTPFGVGNEKFVTAYNRGDRAIKDLTLFPSPNGKRWRVGEVSDFDPGEILGSKGLRNYDRVTLLLLTAAELLHRDLGFDDLDTRRKLFTDEEVSIVVGTMASLKSIGDFDMDTVKDPRYVRPGLFPNSVLCAAASYAAIRHSIQESCVTITNEETSAAYAVGYGVDHLLNNRVKMAIVGAAEELSDIFLMVSLNVSRFNGSNTPAMTEGAQLFSLELADHAAARGAHQMAEVIAFNSWHCPDKQMGYNHGVLVMRKKVGEEMFSQIKHFFSSTKLIDEMTALDNPNVTVHKPFFQFGHLSSMAGSIPIACVLTDQRIQPGELVLIHSMSHSGSGACLLLRKLDHYTPRR